jgi:hypothetical protein
VKFQKNTTYMVPILFIFTFQNFGMWQNCSCQKPCFCLPHGSHLHGGGLPRSHEGRGLRGGAPPCCWRQGGSSPRCCRHRRRSAPLAAPIIVFTAISITNFSLYIVVHPPTHLCTVLCKHGVRCYKLQSYDLCHVCIVYLSFDSLVECLWFIRVVCWYGTVLWCPLYLCAHGLKIIGFVVCVRGRDSSAGVRETWGRESECCMYGSRRTINLRLWLGKP